MRLKTFFAVLLAILMGFAPPAAYAALPGFEKWQVSTGGSDTNGGFFIPGSSGTDRSTTDAAFCTANDLVLVTASTATSATCPFSAASVGNGIYVSGGTGFTVQFCAVISVAVATATLQCVGANAGTAGSTGGSFALGGRLLTVGKNLTSLNSDDTTCIKSGTYTQTTQLNVPNKNGITWEGFSVTCGDLAAQPVITSATNGVDIFAFSSGVNMVFRNLKVSSTAGTRGDCFTASSANSVDKLTLDRMLLDGCQRGIYGDFAVVWSFGQVIVTNSRITNSVQEGIKNSGDISLISSRVDHSGGDGVKPMANASFSIRGLYICDHSVLDHNTGNGWLSTQLNGTNVNVNFCDFSDNGVAGYKETTTADKAQGTWQNSIGYNNGTYFLDITAPTTTAGLIVNNNACGANGTACYNNITSAGGDVTLTADPFVNRGADNFAPNTTAGGGAALKAAGFPGNTTGGANFGTGYPDIGALQSQNTGGAGASMYVQ